MATFTALCDDEVAAIAAGFGLDAVRRWQPIDAGTINSNFSLWTASARYFLRINEGKTEADVAFEGRLVRELANAGVSTPVPHEGPNGLPYLRHNGHFASLFSWIDGTHRGSADVSAKDAFALGAALATLHRVGQNLGLMRRSIYDFDHLVTRFEGFRHRQDSALSPAIGDIAREIEWLREQKTRCAGARQGIIHGDLFRDNVLFSDDGTPTLLDFEQAATGSFSYDIAVCVNAWCYRDHYHSDLVRALIGGYRSVGTLAPGDMESLYPDTRRAAMRFTITRITDVYLAANGAPAGKDFRRYLARLRLLRTLGEEGFRGLLQER